MVLPFRLLGLFPLIENYFGDDDDCDAVLRWMHQKHPDAMYRQIF